MLVAADDLDPANTRCPGNLPCHTKHVCLRRRSLVGLRASNRQLAGYNRECPNAGSRQCNCRIETPPRIESTRSTTSGPFKQRYVPPALRIRRLTPCSRWPRGRTCVPRIKPDQWLRVRHLQASISSGRSGDPFADWEMAHDLRDFAINLMSRRNHTPMELSVSI